MGKACQGRRFPPPARQTMVPAPARDRKAARPPPRNHPPRSPRAPPAPRRHAPTTARQSEARWSSGTQAPRRALAGRTCRHRHPTSRPRPARPLPGRPRLSPRPMPSRGSRAEPDRCPSAWPATSSIGLSTPARHPARRLRHPWIGAPFLCRAPAPTRARPDPLSATRPCRPRGRCASLACYRTAWLPFTEQVVDTGVRPV